MTAEHRRTRISEERIDQVRQLRTEYHYGNKQIVEETGLTRRQVGRILGILEKRGGDVRLKRPYRMKLQGEQFDEQLITLRQDPRNLSLAEMAKATNSSVGAVRSRIRRLGDRMPSWWDTHGS